METKLLGQKVEHNIFGEGIITDIEDKIVTVNFGKTPKKFVYPEVFNKFLELKNEKIQEKVDEINDELKKEKQAKRERELAKQRKIIKLSTIKIVPNSQVAFDVDFDRANRVIEEGNLSTGVYLGGYRKGEPRIVDRIKPNSCCLITTVPDGKTEKDRQILGAFMVDEEFYGEQSNSGVVPAHTKYKLTLPEDKTLSFWSYFKKSAVKKWGSIPFKYFSCDTMKKILNDINENLKETEKASLSADFFDYFRKINRV